MAARTCPFNGHAPCRSDCALRDDIDYTVKDDGKAFSVYRKLADNRGGGRHCALVRIASLMEETVCADMIGRKRKASWFF